MTKLVSTLTGADLDKWVALADGVLPDKIFIYKVPRTDEEVCTVARPMSKGSSQHKVERYDPSTNWAVLGPLLMKYKVSIADNELDNMPVYRYHAQIAENPFSCGHCYPFDKINAESVGETYLIAACRCIVASKFGDEVPDD